MKRNLCETSARISGSIKLGKHRVEGQTPILHTLWCREGHTVTTRASNLAGSTHTKLEVVSINEQVLWRVNDKVQLIECCSIGDASSTELGVIEVDSPAIAFPLDLRALTCHTPVIGYPVELRLRLRLDSDLSITCMAG